MYGGSSDLELKLQGKLRVTVVRCTELKNMERLGKSDPYVRLYVRVLFKSKTRVVYNNLNPEWNEVFNFDVEDTETQNLVMQVRTLQLLQAHRYSENLTLLTVIIKSVMYEQVLCLKLFLCLGSDIHFFWIWFFPVANQQSGIVVKCCR